jgi:dUTP pyrophosphatase
MFVKRIGQHALALPKKETDGSAGFDLRASEHAIIMSGGSSVVPTGFAWQIPSGSVGMICSRSGIAAKHQVFVLNAPGIIDSDYRGEVKVILMNLGPRPFHISPGDRIAQMVMTIALGGCCVHELAELQETKRAGGGLGSTGSG